MTSRSFGNGFALSSQRVKAVMLAGLAALTGCGTSAQSRNAEDNVASSSALLAVTDPSIPLAVPLPQTADPLTAGLVVRADAPQKGQWSSTLPWPLNGLHSVLLPN